MSGYDFNDEQDLALATAEPKLKKPRMYQVIMLNDDYTPMDFVVFFQMPQSKAVEVMQQIHFKGKGVCGIFPRDIAETKALQVTECARDNGHPLLCNFEPAP